jgi:DNA-directed RNA polymerase subunit RPC12/RpoP
LAQFDHERDFLYSRVRTIESDLSGASSTVDNVRSKLASIDAALASLPSRLMTVRSRGYAALAYLEKSVEKLCTRWAETAPRLKQAYAETLEPLAARARMLEADVRRLRLEIDAGNLFLAQSRAGTLSIEASTVRAQAVSEAARISGSLNEFASSIDALDRDLKMAEKTLALFAQASFQLSQQESPVLAIEGKMLSGEKLEGTLYFTNQRFIFEGLKEVVLEKRLFIATKKKTERTVVIQQPIGALAEVTKGRVGLVAWTGVYLRFKPELQLGEVPFDVKDWEADVITRFFKYIIGGEADSDIAAVKGTTVAKEPTAKVLRCPNCSAPYTDEILKGQTTVQCKYCGATILLQ